MDSTRSTKKEVFLKAYEKKLGHITDACRAVMIDRGTYYIWLKDKRFKQEIEHIDNSFIDMAECALRKNIKKGVQKAVEFYLCNKKKDSYTNLITNKHTGTINGNIAITLKERIYNVPGNVPGKEKELKEPKLELIDDTQEPVTVDTPPF